MKTKLERLIEVALIEGSIIATEIDVEHLKRLNDGDLSHIGDAILEGKNILHDNNVRRSLNFGSNTDAYTIVEPTTTSKPVEFVRGETVAPAMWTEFYVPAPHMLDMFLKTKWANHTCDNKHLENGDVYLTSDGAINKSKAYFEAFKND